MDVITVDNLTPLPGDLDGNGAIAAADFDLLCRGLRSGDDRFDLNRDGRANDEDVRYMVRDLAKTRFGDANVDGAFDTGDLVSLFQIGEFEDEIDGNSTWAEGDWNCDGDFTTADLILAFQDGGFVNAAKRELGFPRG
jgi:hypothetical protein